MNHGEQARHRLCQRSIPSFLAMFNKFLGRGHSQLDGTCLFIKREMRWIWTSLEFHGEKLTERFSGPKSWKSSYLATARGESKKSWKGKSARKDCPALTYDTEKELRYHGVGVASVDFIRGEKLVETLEKERGKLAVEKKTQPEGTRGWTMKCVVFSVYWKEVLKNTKIRDKVNMDAKTPS